ncbi:DUF3618 domain-containing protein [Actinomadura yumaensis]|uniref:DUF3618 domain-containing protein n=1 Tax=Actinomadura yumaensis TaxID=111807 RepID=A0ABW2CT21_9ACTN
MTDDHTTRSGATGGDPTGDQPVPVLMNPQAAGGHPTGPNDSRTPEQRATRTPKEQDSRTAEKRGSSTSEQARGGAARDTGPSEDTGPPEDTDSPEELRAHIERTRADLGDTVEALVAKTDVKARAKAKAGQVGQNVKARARGKAGQARAKAENAKGTVRQAQDQTKAKAREASASETRRGQARRGAMAAGGALLAAGVTVGWIRLRRARRAQQRSPWQRAARTARSSAAQMRGKAAGLGAAVNQSDVPGRVGDRGQEAAARLASRSRRAASSSRGRPRLLGAATAAAVLVAAERGRRRATRSE